MKGAYKTESIRRAERAAKERTGEDELIERAAAKLLETVERVPFSRAVIVAGGGNNGSDALSLAHLLIERAYDVAVYVAGDKRNEFVGKRIAALTELGADITLVSSADDIVISPGDLVVDGLLGIGCNRNIAGIMSDIVHKINASGAFVVAVDVPTGLDSDTGRVRGCAVVANETVTFIGSNRGCTSPTAQLCRADHIVRHRRGRGRAGLLHSGERRRAPARTFARFQ